MRKKELNIVPEIELGSIDLLMSFAEIKFGISYVVKHFIIDYINVSGK